MQVTATKSIHIIIQELMNLLHSFHPGRISSLPLSVLMSSVLTNYVIVHVCILKHMQWNNEEVLLQGSIIVSLTLYFRI